MSLAGRLLRSSVCSGVAHCHSIKNRHQGCDWSLYCEQLFLYQPRLVIVSAPSKVPDRHGINEDKYSSELFRSHLVAPEAIMFDKAFERAKFIVEAHASSKNG
jgi:hypothetical protein